MPNTPRRTLTRLAIAGVLLLGLAGLLAMLRATSQGPVNPVTGGAAAETVVMDFATTFDPAAPPAGWVHRTFWTRPAMLVSFANKEGVPALRCETKAGGSIFGRWTDIALTGAATLKWRWLVEKPIAAASDEATKAGDDHPVRLFLAFADATGAAHHAEIIWSNRSFKRGDWKIIDGFVHYVADGGDSNVGQWREQSADLLAIYRKASGRSDTPRLKQVAIFCDSDDTGTSSIAYTGGQVVLVR